MTTIPTVRPPVPIAGRPASSGATVAPAIDPIKLVKKHKWTLLAAAVAGTILGAIGHVVLMQTYPVYAPFALYECAPLRSQPGDPAPAMGFKDELEKFMATQVQLVLSDRTVEKTLSDPSFTSEAPRWSRAFLDRNGAIDMVQASRALRRNLSAGVVGESSLVRVSFWWTDPTEATAIVRRVGQAYERDRRQITGTMTNDRLDQLKKAVDEIGDTIVRRQTDRETLLQNQSVDSL